MYSASNSKKFWNYISKGLKDYICITQIKSDNLLISDFSEIGNKFNEYFSSIYSKPVSYVLNSNDIEIIITEKNVDLAIKSLSNKQSCGNDNIPSIFWKVVNLCF